MRKLLPWWAWAANDYIPCRWRGTVYIRRDWGPGQREAEEEERRAGQGKSSAAPNPRFSPFSTSQDLHFSILWVNPASFPARWGNTFLLMLSLLATPSTERVLTNPLSNWTDDRATYWSRQQEVEENPLLWKVWSLWVHLIQEGGEDSSGCQEVSQIGIGVLCDFCLHLGWWLTPNVIMCNHSSSWEFRLRLCSF